MVGRRDGEGNEKRKDLSLLDGIVLVEVGLDKVLAPPLCVAGGGGGQLHLLARLGNHRREMCGGGNATEAVECERGAAGGRRGCRR